MDLNTVKKIEGIVLFKNIAKMVVFAVFWICNIYDNIILEKEYPFGANEESNSNIRSKCNVIHHSLCNES